MRERFPNEQPEDVWSRTLAVLMSEGKSIDDISRLLLEVSPQFRLTKAIEGISSQARENELQKLRDVIAEYWPKKKWLFRISPLKTKHTRGDLE